MSQPVTLGEIAVQLKAGARELSPEQHAKLPDLLWEALSTRVGGLRQSRTS